MTFLVRLLSWFAVPMAALISTQAISASADQPVITLARTACFGSCPVYVVELLPSGDVVFTGMKHVAEIGVRKATIGAESYGQAVEAVRASRFDKLQRSYVASADGCESNTSDHPTLKISVELNGIVEMVLRGEGCDGSRIKDDLTGVDRLAAQIDRIAGTSRWIGTIVPEQ
jgi:hypothetical protein